MLSKIFTYGISCLDAYLMTIEVDVARGLPAMNIVGLPDSSIRESKDRVRTAIKNSGFKFPIGRVTVNMAPAEMKKEGASFDLAIALGILAASEQISLSKLKDYIFLGELSLDGRIKPVRGALSISMSADCEMFKGIVLPEQNTQEALITKRLPVYTFETLTQVIFFLQDPNSVASLELDEVYLQQGINQYNIDFSEVKGQFNVKRGLEVAAAGGHNVILIGPPGSGKTMLAKRLLTILPDMTRSEALETTKIHSVVGLISKNGIVTARPFRSPHHTSSDVALVGGGSIPKPGEVTLAHNGILFLDELPEFSRNVLETLRQPLEDNEVTIARASQTVKFPSRFMLACTMNPCHCGWYSDPTRECHCSDVQIQRYLSKISGPLLDRIDIHLEVPALKSIDLFTRQPKSEASEQIKERTTKARLFQQQRFEAEVFSINSQMGHREIEKYCLLSNEGRDLLKKAVEELKLSARAHDKILKLARTIADLEEIEDINPDHISEAIQYRSLDRSWWG